MFHRRSKITTKKKLQKAQRSIEFVQHQTSSLLGDHIDDVGNVFDDAASGVDGCDARNPDNPEEQGTVGLAHRGTHDPVHLALKAFCKDQIFYKLPISLETKLLLRMHLGSLRRHACARRCRSMPCTDQFPGKNKTISE